MSCVLEASSVHDRYLICGRVVFNTNRRRASRRRRACLLPRWLRFSAWATTRRDRRPVPARTAHRCGSWRSCCSAFATARVVKSLQVVRPTANINETVQSSCLPVEPSSCNTCRSGVAHAMRQGDSPCGALCNVCERRTAPHAGGDHTSGRCGQQERWLEDVQKLVHVLDARVSSLAAIVEDAHLLLR